MKQNLCIQVASTTNCIWTCMYFFILVTRNKSRFLFNRDSLKSDKRRVPLDQASADCGGCTDFFPQSWLR